jgi:hypothetical protein
MLRTEAGWRCQDDEVDIAFQNFLVGVKTDKLTFRGDIQFVAVVAL